MSELAARLENPLSARLRDPAVMGYSGLSSASWRLPRHSADRGAHGHLVGGRRHRRRALGTFTITRGRRRLGIGAVVAGVIGIGLGVLATRSGAGNLEAVFNASLIAQTLAFSTPLVFGAIAGMFSERSGVVNIGLEGMMLMGAFWGVYGADKGGSWVVGILVGWRVGGLLALIYGFFAIHLRADQIVGGTAVNFLALGITGYFFFQLYHGSYVPQGVSTIPNVKIPGSRAGSSSGRRSGTSA